MFSNPDDEVYWRFFAARPSRDPARWRPTAEQFRLMRRVRDLYDECDRLMQGSLYGWAEIETEWDYAKWVTSNDEELERVVRRMERICELVRRRAEKAH